MFFGIWIFQYFLSYLQGAFSIIVMLGGLGLWFLLLGLALFQVFKLVIEKTKQYERLIYVAVILILNLLSFAYPMGLVNWEKYESENILVAETEGTANCWTIIKLKNNNKFKYLSRCFGVNIYLGTYKFKNDTLYFELDKEVGFMDKSSYVTLLKSETDTTRYR